MDWAYGRIDAMAFPYLLIIPIVNPPGTLAWIYFGPVGSLLISTIFWAYLSYKLPYLYHFLAFRKPWTFKMICIVAVFLIVGYFLSGAFFSIYAFGGGLNCSYP